jgi:ABC-type glycerol-3-phosphate transport system permease component
MNRSKRFDMYTLLIYVVLFMGLFATLFPFLYMVSTSLKGTVFVFEYPPKIIPSNPTLANYVSAWNSNHFETYFLNSVVVTCVTTLSVLLLSSMMGFAFARFNFPLRKTLFSVVMILMMLPAMTLLIPQFILAVKFKLINTLMGLILVYIAQNLPMNTFLLTGFMKSIPVELIDAARIDGASWWTVFTKIMLPLSKPALATVAIFASLGAWDEYTWAVTILNKTEVRTLPVGIALFQGIHSTDWGLVFAASIIAITPIIILFIVLQKYFIHGALTGAIKG